MCPRSRAGWCILRGSFCAAVSCRWRAAPSVVNAHKFSTFPTCRQALPCIPTTLSVGRESALSAPVQGDQQNYSLQVSKLQQIRSGVAFFPNQVQICVGRGNGWREYVCKSYFGKHPQVSECRVVLGGPSGPPVNALLSSEPFPFLLV